MWLHFTDEALRHQKIRDLVRSLSQQGSMQDRHPGLSDRTATWGFLGSGWLEQFSTLALKVTANPFQPAFVLWSFLHKPFPSETISQLGPALLFLNSGSYVLSLVRNGLPSPPSTSNSVLLPSPVPITTKKPSLAFSTWAHTLSGVDASLPESEVLVLSQTALPMRGKLVPDIHWFYKARFCASFFICRPHWI